MRERLEERRVEWESHRLEIALRLELRQAVEAGPGLGRSEAEGRDRRLLLPHTREAGRVDEHEAVYERVADRFGTAQHVRCEEHEAYELVAAVHAG